jgi:hypothetical protein
MHRHILLAALAALALTPATGGTSAAHPLGLAGASLQSDDSMIELVAARGGGRGAAGRGAAARTTAVRGPRGGTAVRRTTVARPGVRPGVRPVAGAAVARPGRWVRPASYRWAPGGAIAAGAAIGVVGAATAAAWAGAAPGPNMCWYYTDPTQRQGFWDVCQ